MSDPDPDVGGRPAGCRTARWRNDQRPIFPPARGM